MKRQFTSATKLLSRMMSEPNHFKSPHEAAYANLLIGLASESLTIHAHAVRAYREQCLPYLAWATRGLLELALWTDYCSRSPDNAKRFIQDTIRDHVGLLDALGLTDRVLSHPESTGTEVDHLQALLRTVASALDMDGLNAKFTRVADAAREMGMIEAYSAINRALSKFVHPTALVTNTPVLDELVGVFSRKFIEMADVSASIVFQVIKREQKTFRLCAR